MTTSQTRYHSSARVVSSTLLFIVQTIAPERQYMSDVGAEAQQHGRRACEHLEASPPERGPLHVANVRYAHMRQRQRLIALRPPLLQAVWLSG